MSFFRLATHEHEAAASPPYPLDDPKRRMLIRVNTLEEGNYIYSYNQPSCLFEE
jgi:hypothetical protein